MRELDGIIARSFGESRFVLAKLITQQNPKFTIVNTGDIWIVFVPRLSRWEYETP